jgi:citrate transporter
MFTDLTWRTADAMCETIFPIGDGGSRYERQVIAEMPAGRTVAESFSALPVSMSTMSLALWARSAGRFGLAMARDRTGRPPEDCYVLLFAAGVAIWNMVRAISPVGEKIIVNHDQGGFKGGWLTIELLVLFVGLFVLSGGIERAGLVDDLVGWAGAAGLHRPAILTVTTAVLSNLVSNVAAVLLLKPLIPSFGEPDRGWLILAMASTLVGNLTILGSVANLIVVEVARESRVRIGFLEYCRVGVPLTVLTLLLGWLILIAVPV